MYICGIAPQKKLELAIQRTVGRMCPWHCSHLNEHQPGPTSEVAGQLAGKIRLVKTRRSVSKNLVLYSPPVHRWSDEGVPNVHQLAVDVSQAVLAVLVRATMAQLRGAKSIC